MKCTVMCKYCLGVECLNGKIAEELEGELDLNEEMVDDPNGLYLKTISLIGLTHSKPDFLMQYVLVLQAINSREESSQKIFF